MELSSIVSRDITVTWNSTLVEFPETENPIFKMKQRYFVKVSIILIWLSPPCETNCYRLLRLRAQSQWRILPPTVCSDFCFHRKSLSYEGLLANTYFQKSVFIFRCDSISSVYPQMSVSSHFWKVHQFYIYRTLPTCQHDNKILS